MFPPIPKTLNSTDYNNILKSKILKVKICNRVDLPALAGYYLYMHNNHKAFTPLSTKLTFVGLTSPTTVNMLNKNKSNNENKNPNQNKNRFKFIILFIIVILSIIFIFFIFHFFNYFTLTNLFSMVSFWIKYFLLIWFIGWWLHHVLEFYLFLVLSINSNYITISKFYPQFLLNWIKRIKSNSKISNTGKIWYINTYLRLILFYSVLLFLYILLFIFFL